MRVGNASVLWLALCAACGSRVEVDASTEGAGGSGQTGSGGNGAAPACEGLKVTDPILTLEDAIGMDQMTPALIPTLSGERVTLLSAWFSASQQGELRHSSLYPWGASWPTANVLAPSLIANPSTNGSFAAAPSTGEHIAVWMGEWHTGFLSPDLIPESSQVPAKFHFDWYNAALGLPYTYEPAFLGDLKDGAYLLGTRVTGGGGLAPATTMGSALAVEGRFLFACGAQYINADAVAVRDGWLLASSSTANGIGCVDPAPGLGPPDHLMIARVAPSGAFTIATTLVAEGIGQVRIARRAVVDSDAWIAWSMFDQQIVFARFDTLGNPVSDAFNVIAPGELYYDGFGIAEMGERLVVAFERKRRGEPNDVVGRVFDAGGQLQLEASVPLDTSYDHYGSPAVVVSPDTHAFLVAYTEGTAGGMRVRLARFEECR